MAWKCDWLLGHDWTYRSHSRRRCVRCERHERGVGCYESRNLLIPFFIMNSGIQWEAGDA